MNFKNVFIPIYISLNLWLAITNGNSKVEFRAARSKFSRTYFTNFTLTAANSSLSTDMYIIKNLNPGFMAFLDFKIRLPNSKKYQTLFTYTADVCGIVISLKDTIFKKWFKSVLRYGNFMTNCPVVPGHYYLRNWRLDAEMIPPYLYPGDYRVRGYGFFGKRKTKTENFVVDCEVDAIIL